MKRIINNLLIAVVVASTLPACTKFTEITPKGANILSRVSDLDLILNYTFSGDANAGDTTSALTTAQNAFSPNDVENLVNDQYPNLVNVPNLLSAGVKSLNYALTFYDEKTDRKTLATSDVKYEKMYFIINNVCNVVLRNAGQASGDRALANQYKAEAYVLRAYFHYLLVNFYAKGYNPASAAADGGIPYVKEDNVITEPNVKLSVAEVYKNIIADLDAAFKLNSLPRVPVNNMRTGQGFAWAVRAKVLLATRDFAGAQTAADSSLAINSYINDDRLYAPVGTLPFTKVKVTRPEYLFYAAASNLLFNSPSLEMVNNYYEPGNIVNSYIKPYYPGDNPFTGLPGVKGFYVTTGSFYENTAGLTTSDTWLIKAECLARAGRLTESMNALNTIRQNRIHPSVYQPLTATTTAQAMGYIMRAARTEFLYTMRGYLDIKRWNTEDAYKQTITRTISGVTYSLAPESPLWIFPFPQSATSYNPNLTQNY